MVELKSVEGIEQALEQLSKVENSISVERIFANIQNQKSFEKRQIALSIVGGTITTIGALVFFSEGDIRQGIGLVVGTLVFIATLYLSKRKLTKFSQTDSSVSLFSQWQEEISKQIYGHSFSGPVATLLFALLTGFLVWKFGISYYKVWPYLLTLGMVASYVIYHYIVILPVLREELKSLQQEIDVL